MGGNIRKKINNLVYKHKPWKLVNKIGKFQPFVNILQKIFYSSFSGPKSIKIHINSACNYDCLYCYSDDLRKALPKTAWLKLIDDIEKYSVHTVEISGGEPFMSKDLEDILKKIRSKGMQATIYTNGSLINDKWIKRLAHLKKITLSIKYDNAKNYKRLTGQHITKIDKIIKQAIFNNIPVVCFVTVTSKGFKQLKETINKIINLGAFPAIERYMPVKNNNINCKLEINRLQWDTALRYIEEAYANFKPVIQGVNIIQGNICSCYLTQFSVLQDGSVIPCQFMPSSEKIGDITTNSVEVIWSIFESRRKKWLKIPEDCSDCSQKKLCRGGCKTHAFYKGTKIDPLCNKRTTMSYGHCAFTVVHFLDNSDNSKLKRLK